MNRLLDARRIACPLCGSAESGRRYRVRGYAIARCSGCGLWMLNPQPTREALSAFYEGSYYANRQWIGTVGAETVMRMSAGKSRAYRQALVQISRHAPGPRLLDVGCAFGQFLQVAAQAGYSVEGIELDRVVAARARDLGFRVEGGDFSEVDFLPRSLDVVTFWYVLEHLTDPMAYARKSCDLLRPGGILFVRVPNMLFGLPFLYSGLASSGRSPSILSHIPAHLFFFTPGTLRRLLETAGFEVLQMEHGAPILEDGSGWRSRLADGARRIEAGGAEVLSALSRHQLLCGAHLSVYARKKESCA